MIRPPTASFREEAGPRWRRWTPPAAVGTQRGATAAPVREVQPVEQRTWHQAQLWLWLCLLVVPRVLAVGRCFRADGTFTRTVLASGYQSTNQFSFSVTVSDCLYAVKVMADGRTNQMGHEEVAYDGRDFYQVRYLNEAPLSARTNGQPVEINAFVRSQRIPSIVGGSWLPHVWFPFGAGCYLRTVASGLVTSEFLTPASAADSFRPAKVWFYPGDSNVVQRMVILCPGYFQNPGQKLIHRYPPPFDQGFTNMIYLCRSARRVGGTLVPTSFRWTCYDVSAHGSRKPEWRPVWALEGTVEHIEPSPAVGDFQPVLAGEAAIFDYRLDELSKVAAEPYFAREFWQPGEARFEKEVRARVAKRESSAGSPVGRTPLLVFLCLFLAAATFAAFRYGRAPA